MDTFNTSDPQLFNSTKEEEFNLLPLIRGIFRFKWGILGLALVVTLIATVVAYSLRPVYRASTTLLIEPPSNQRAVSLEEMFYAGRAPANYFQTQYEVITSRDVALRVVEKLDLAQHPEFQPRQDANWWQQLGARFGFDFQTPDLDFFGFLPFLPAPEPAAPQDPEALAADTVRADQRRLNGLADNIRHRLGVRPLDRTQIVQLSFASNSPQLAADVVNTFAEAYIESSLDARLEATRQTSAWLTERLAGMRENLERSEKALQAFREREGLVQQTGGVLSILEQELADNNSKLSAARGERMQLETVYQQVRAAGNNLDRLLNIPQIASNESVSGAQSAYRAAQAEINQLQSRYGPRHPQMVAATTRRDQARANVQQLAMAAASTIRTQYQVARDNEQSMTRLTAESRASMQDLNRNRHELRVLERDVETNRQLYDMFLTRFKETGAAEGVQSVNARVLDEALVPGGPFKPNRQQIIRTAFILSIMAGIGLALLLNILDNTFKTAEDLEGLLGVHVLGTIPLMRRFLSRNEQVHQIVLEQDHAPFTEALRTVRTGVLLSAGNLGTGKRLVVTSSTMAEGKTSMSMGLAFTLGQMEKVLLIDADMRKPAVGRNLGLSSKTPGLSDLVAGIEPLEKCLLHHEASGIDVIPAGTLPPNPLDLISSQRFEKLMEGLEGSYDRIIIDTPPCQLVSDALVLSRRAHGLIFVVRADSTPKPVVKANIKRLRQAEIQILGTVLNQFDAKKASKYYGGYYHSHYDGAYYGYAYKS